MAKAQGPGGVGVQFKGKNNSLKLRRALHQLQGQTLASGKTVVNKILRDIYEASQSEVPYRSGDLQESGTLHRAKFTGGRVFGGVTYSASNRGFDYALIQHETPDPPWSHLPGRKWKYISDPVARYKTELRAALRTIYASGLHASLRSGGFYRVMNVWT